MLCYVMLCYVRLGCIVIIVLHVLTGMGTGFNKYIISTFPIFTRNVMYLLLQTVYVEINIHS